MRAPLAVATCDRGHSANLAERNALSIRARAEMRLAEEYDAAQAGGEVPGRGGDRRSTDFKSSEASFDRSNLGLNDPDLQEARRMHEAEKADPGVVDRTNNLLERMRPRAVPS